MALPGPVFHERLYDAVGALIVFIVGIGILTKAGNRLGWLFVAAALGWAYLTFRDLIFM
jgi:hypothetical protein